MESEYSAITVNLNSNNSDFDSESEAEPDIKRHLPILNGHRHKMGEVASVKEIFGFPITKQIFGSLVQ